MAEPAATWRVLDDLPVAAALVDLTGTIRHVNAAAVRRYGWRSAEAAVGMSAAVLGQGLPERVGSGTWRGELPATGGPNGTFLGMFDVSPFHDEAGEVVGSIVVCLDATRRAEAERAAERLARLQAVTARLVGARSADDIASVVCDHAAAGLGAESAVFLQLVDDGAMFQLVRQIGFSAEAADGFQRFPSDAPLPAADAIRTRSIVVLADESERDTRYPQFEPHPMRKQAHAVVPMFFGDRAEGAVGLGFRRPIHLDDDDRRFLLAVAAQAAQALDRVRRDDVERSARRRQELLARATGVLAGSVDPEGMATTVGRLAVQDLADSWSVFISDGVSLHTATVHRDPTLEQQLVELAADPRGAELTRRLDGVVAPGRSLLLPVIEPHDWLRWLGDQSQADTMRRFDVASAIVVGLHSGGKRLGVLSTTRRSGRAPFDQDDFVLVAELAGRLAAAIDGAMAHRARAEVARTLQASLLPPRLPEIDGIAVAARYDPVGDGSLVGGDFYDAFPIGSDRWGLVLGDVCGQGVPAAALTSLVRYTVRAAARIWPSPVDILRFTNGAILDDDTGERFCTLLVCVLRPRPDGATLTLASAGHHLPLLHIKGGTPEPVGAPGTALGLVRDLDVVETTLELGLGDVLVLSTDGVIEARAPDGAMVDERFLEDLLVEHAGEGAEAVAGAIEGAVLAISGGRARDDVAVVVAEVTGVSDGAVPPEVPMPVAGPFRQRYRAELAEVPAARRSVAAWLAGQNVRAAIVPDLLLVVTELVTNAIRAARSTVEVRCWLTDDAVTVEVTDDGPGFAPGTQRTPREPDPLAERGRGLFLVAALVDECTIESGPNGTIVRCFAVK